MRLLIAAAFAFAVVLAHPILAGQGAIAAPIPAFDAATFTRVAEEAEADRDCIAAGETCQAKFETVPKPGGGSRRIKFQICEMNGKVTSTRPWAKRKKKKCPETG